MIAPIAWASLKAAAGRRTPNSVVFLPESALGTEKPSKALQENFVQDTLKKIWGRVYGAHERNFQYFAVRQVIFSLIAVIGFPLYYFIWHEVFPQPYENLALRLVGSALFLPLVFLNHWPTEWRKVLPIYWYIALLYALPFFFTFMLLQNHGSTVWLLSTLIAVFVMILLLDWLNLIIHFVVGTTLAWIVFFLSAEDTNIVILHLEHLPIYLFAVVLGAAANFNSEMVKQEQARAMLATASGIAHELRTPLLGINSGAAGLRSYLPTLLEAYRQAQAHGLDVQPIRSVHLRAMDGVLDRIGMETYYSNTVIDMLLTSVYPTGMKTGDKSECSMAKCVAMAIQRYPFATERERALVSWNRGADFIFAGAELLMVHVLFNLLKNALRHIARSGKGTISIRFETSAKENRLIFRDEGSGIAPEVLPHVFTRFYSWPAGGDSLMGSGIGLAFCRDVMRAFGGDIVCGSELGKYTEFTLRLPRI